MDCGMSHREAITLTPLPSTVFESLLFPDLPFGFLIVWSVVLTDWSVVLFPSSNSLFSEHLVALMQMSTLSEAFPTCFPTPGRWEFLPSCPATNWTPLWVCPRDSSHGLCSTPSRQLLPCLLPFLLPHIHECLYPPISD